MKRSPLISLSTSQRGAGFSLIEVVLAIGIFLITVLALVGLLGPTLQSVDEVEKTDEVSSIVNTVNAYLQSSPDIAGAGNSKFNAIYEAVTAGGNQFATLFVFREYVDETSNNAKVAIGFRSDDAATTSTGTVFSTSSDFSDAVGTIYRVVLTPSSVNPTTQMNTNADEKAYPRYTMIETDPSSYPEGYFAMEVRIFAEERVAGGEFDIGKDLDELALTPALFTYNTAIVR